MEKMVPRGLIASGPLDSVGPSVDVWMDNIVARAKMVPNYESAIVEGSQRRCGRSNPLAGITSPREPSL